MANETCWTHDDGMDLSEALQARASAAFRAWLSAGLRARGIEDLSDAAAQLKVAVDALADLWLDNKSLAGLGMRTASSVHSYLTQHAWSILIDAGIAGETAFLPPPQLPEAVEELVEAWSDEADGTLAAWEAGSIQRLIGLAVEGAVSQVQLGFSHVPAAPAKNREEGG